MISSSKNCWRGKSLRALSGSDDARLPQSSPAPHVRVSSDRVWPQLLDFQRFVTRRGGMGVGVVVVGGGLGSSGGSAPVNMGGEAQERRGVVFFPLSSSLFP